MDVTKIDLTRKQDFVMIPKIIHYCWFGGNPLPKSAHKCIESWKKFFPDYEIKEWNESSFDFNKMPYTKEAYAVKKYAFVSDVARFWILYHEGGLYFDTDVEVIRSMDDIVERGAFMGIETPANEGLTYPTVNSGLCMGCEPGHPFFADVLRYYQKQSFRSADGINDLTTIVTHITGLLIERGLEKTNTIQSCAGITIYPKDFFCPFDNNTGRLEKTKNTRSIHWYSMTWLEDRSYLRTWIARLFHRYLGVNCLVQIKKYLKNVK